MLCGKSISIIQRKKVHPKPSQILSQPIKSFKLYSNAFALKAEYYHFSQPQRSSFLILLISFFFCGNKNSYHGTNYILYHIIFLFSESIFIMEIVSWAVFFYFIFGFCFCTIVMEVFPVIIGKIFSFITFLKLPACEEYFVVQHKENKFNFMKLNCNLD